MASWARNRAGTMDRQLTNSYANHWPQLSSPSPRNALGKSGPCDSGGAFLANPVITNSKGEPAYGSASPKAGI